MPPVRTRAGFGKNWQVDDGTPTPAVALGYSEISPHLLTLVFDEQTAQGGTLCRPGGIGRFFQVLFIFPSS